jgi:hypothetical protein
MKLKAILRAVARRLRTPAAIRAARARSEPPAAFAAQPPTDSPPTDFSLPASTAYDPANMVPSSSVAHMLVVLGSQDLPPLALQHLEAPCVDKFVVDSPASPVLLPLSQASDASLPAVAPALDLGASALGSGALGASGVGSSAEEYASREMDSGSEASGSSWQEGRPRHADA